jgi:phytanoyl-CoA hydroxylase
MPFTGFTPEQVRQFREEGWIAVPDFWAPDEVGAMRVELDRLVSEGKLRNVATDGDGKTHSQTKANLQVCPLWPHSDLFRAMPFAPVVVSAVEALIGGPVLLHLDQVFLKPGGHGAGTNWHQDNAYFKIPDPLHGTAVWTAVHDATVANGTLRVIPRAFREQMEHSRDPESDHHIRCWPDESRAITVEIPAGGAIFFAYGTPHATGANRTDHARAGIALHFLNADQDGAALSGFAPGKRPFLTGPEATGGAREYGERIAGTWDAQVKQTTAAAA